MDLSPSQRWWSSDDGRVRIIPVERTDDPALDDYRNLTDVSLRRRLEPEHGIFMAESQTVIKRALNAGYEPKSALTNERWLSQVQTLMHDQSIDIHVGSDELLQRITGYRVHRGALAVMKRRALPSIESVVAPARRLVVLEGVVDHTNVGAVFRWIPRAPTRCIAVP